MVRKIKTLYNLITFGNNFLLVNGMRNLLIKLKLNSQNIKIRISFF